MIKGRADSQPTVGFTAFVNQKRATECLCRQRQDQLEIWWDNLQSSMAAMLLDALVVRKRFSSHHQLLNPVHVAVKLVESLLKIIKM